MARKKVPLVPDRPYHIGSTCSNREWFKIPIEEVWEITTRYLRLVQFSFDFEILSFVLMNNHFHMLATFPNLNMAESMNYFLREVSKEINRTAQREHHAFKRPYFRSMINSYHYYTHAYKYVYRNPVEAGICKNAEDYPYSTLHGLLGASRNLISVAGDETLFSDLNGTLKWLNTQPSKAHREAVRRALHRSEFGFPDAKNKAPHPLEHRMY